MTHSPDAAYKLLFSTREVVRDLVTGFIDDAWLSGLDLGSLEKVPTNFVDPRLRQRISDVVWRVRTGDGAWTYLYLLIEFQSRSDHAMAVRIMGYVALLWQDILRTEVTLARLRKLPPVLPIVVYNGLCPWRAATDIADLIAPVSEGLADHLPRMKYLLIDQSSYTEAQLAPMRNLMAAVMRLERPSGRQALLDAVGDLRRWVAGAPELERVFSAWMHAMFAERPTLAGSSDIDLKENTVGLRETLRIWEGEFLARGRQEGREEGWEEGQQTGRHQGEALMLQRLLAKRFGPLPSAIVERIASAPTERIELWGDRMLEAQSLADVFSND